MAEETAVEPQDTAIPEAGDQGTAVQEPVAQEPVAQESPVVAPAPTEQWDDIRDYAKANGFDITHIPDSAQAAKYLIDMARNNSAYAQYGQQLAPYYSEIQNYLASRAQQQVPAAQPAQNYFGLPEYDPKWLDWLERDAAGNVLPKVGAPPDLVGKVVNYQRALSEFQNRFYQRPQDVLQPLIRDSVAPLVHQAIQQSLRNYQDQSFATNFTAQNTGWLHYRDPQGQIIRDPVTGGFALTPEGQLFVQHLRRAESMGIRDLQAQQAYAMDQLRLAYFASQAQQGQAVQNAAQRDQQFLHDRNRHAPNAGGSLNAGPGLSQNASLSLEERLRRDLTQGGITDGTLRQEFAGTP